MTIHVGDCVTVMAGMPADSVDAIVTDPPAGISFMSKHWDRDKGGRTEWVAWMTEVMSECYRVLKPGGYAVVWSLPRTCHWTAWAMEDAGFIIRDQLAHIFASGFPKGKAQLKPAREDWWLARKPGPLRPLNIEETRIGTESIPRTPATSIYGTPMTKKWPAHANGMVCGGDDCPVIDEHGDHPNDYASAGRWPSNLLLSDPELFDEPNPWVVGSGATSVGGWKPVHSSDHACDWPGCVGQCHTGETCPCHPTSNGEQGDSGYSRFYRIPRNKDGICTDCAAPHANDSSIGINDESTVANHVGMPVARCGYPIAWIIPKADRADREPLLRGQLPKRESRTLGDKAQGPLPQQTPTVPAIRENHHPTVKPLDLMRHLIRLVTPPGGTVLDPFLGSGSTAIAAELEGFPWIGIEKEPEYVAIAEARLNGTQRGLGLDVGAPTRKRATSANKTTERPNRSAAPQGFRGPWKGTGKLADEEAERAS